MKEAPTIIIGAGMAGLVSAALLSARGVPVVVIEKAQQPGGKARQVMVDGVPVDAGPTVFTMRPVLEAIFADAGANIDDHLQMVQAQRLARHAWDGDETLDLFADTGRSIDAVGAFAGARAADGFRRFTEDSKRVYDILDKPFMQDSKAGPIGLMRRIGLTRVGSLLAIRPYETMWKVLGEYFEDQRLRQLFGRYTTYCGSSPFDTPATLMLIASVEAQGVWKITGGISALAKALEQVAIGNGARFLYGEAVEEITVRRSRADGVRLSNGEHFEAANVICNADPSALGAGLFGSAARKAVRQTPPKRRSLSAMVWLARAKTRGFALDYHNVFFSGNYRQEFDDIKAGRPPDEPTAYVCALDRGAKDWPDGAAERLQVIVNAPANGDSKDYTREERQQCTAKMLQRLSHCGLELEAPQNQTDLPHQLVTPNEFNTLFPATGGALYGRDSHGWAASFLRPGCRTKVSGLYCTGGGTHPGAGVPMAALSGRLASETVLADLSLTPMSHRRAITGGTSTPSAMTNATG